MGIFLTRPLSFFFSKDRSSKGRRLRELAPWPLPPPIFYPRLYLRRGRNRRGMGSPSISAPNPTRPPPPLPPPTTIRPTMCHFLCGGFFFSFFPRLPFYYSIIKSGQRDKNKTLRVLFLRKKKRPLF